MILVIQISILIFGTHFAQLKEAGVNATRVWINCDGYGSININANGTITGATAKHWTDLDEFFEAAARNKLYIMATLTSFDHFDKDKRHYDRFRAMIANKEASRSFAENYTIPFVNRYKNNPWLWSIDIMNEPEWVFEDEKCGKLAWDDISYFLAVNAAAVRKNSNILITVGMASCKYNADCNGYEGNKVSDTYLKSLSGDNDAYLDFWSPHYYAWVSEWYGVPFYLTPSGARLGSNSNGYSGGWGLDASKPAVLGECAAFGTSGTTEIDPPRQIKTERDFIAAALRPESNSLISDYQYAYNNGWQGVMAWTSNGADNHGSLTDISPATLNMLANYNDIIFPFEE